MKTQFPVELDHVFVWVQPSGPEEQIFAELGLYSSGHGEHKGQGTASKFILFENAYLELIWISDEGEARENTARTGIEWCDRARWRETGASPFGVGLHRIAPTLEELPLFPVKYSAEWMMPGTYLEFSDNFKQATEPLYFIVPEWVATDNMRLYPEIIKTDIHPWIDKKLTSVKVSLGRFGELSTVASELSCHTAVAVEPDNSSLLELTFDSGSLGKTFDARPTLPIVFKY